MTALAADKIVRKRANAGARIGEGDVAASTIIYLGSLLAKNAAGHVVPAADTAALKVIGVSEEFVDNSAGLAAAKTCKYSTGAEFEFINLGGNIVQAGKHVACYVEDDQTVTSAADATNDIIAGIVTEFSATKVWVYVDELIESNALVTPLDGADAGVVADAQVLGGIPVLHIITVGDVASGNTDVVLTEKTEVVDFWVQKINGAGAANTAQLFNGASAISSALACAVDDAITRAVSLVDAATVIAAGGTLRIAHVKAAGTGNLRAFILGVKRT